MSGYLLNTNVISELTSDNAAPRVIEYVARLQEQWLSSVVVYELEHGVQLLPAGRRRDRIYAAHVRFLEQYNHRIIPLDRMAAESAARCRVQLRRLGRTMDLADALIAGTAVANDLKLVTRNVRDFQGIGVEIIDPWQTVVS